MGRIRRPAVAGAFYPGTAGELEAAVRGYLRDARPARRRPRRDGSRHERPLVAVPPARRAGLDEVSEHLASLLVHHAQAEDLLSDGPSPPPGLQENPVPVPDKECGKEQHRQHHPRGHRQERGYKCRARRAGIVRVCLRRHVQSTSRS